MRLLCVVQRYGIEVAGARMIVHNLVARALPVEYPPPSEHDRAQKKGLD